MSKEDKKIVELSEEVKELEKEAISRVREGTERWKDYMDATTDIFEKWHYEKSVWATAIKFIAMNVSDEFEFEIPEDDKEDNFYVEVHVYPKEDNPNIWTVKLDVTHCGDDK